MEISLRQRFNDIRTPSFQLECDRGDTTLERIVLSVSLRDAEVLKICHEFHVVSKIYGAQTTSGLPRLTDIVRPPRQVRFVPRTEVVTRHEYRETALAT